MTGRLAVMMGLALLAASPDHAADNQVGEPRSAAEALLRSVRTVAGKVETLRGEKFSRPVVAVRVPEDLRRAAAEIRAFKLVGKPQLRARGRAWGDLGLGGSASPERLVTLLCRDLESIGFDPFENRLLVSHDLLTDEDFSPTEELDAPAAILMATGVRRDEPLVAHVLMHVRQRERNAVDHLAETTDAMLARAALAEGEANLLALGYLFEGMGLHNDLTTFSLSPGEYLDGGLVPKDFETLIGAEADLLRFVYLEGFGQAVEQFAAGGWSRVDKAIRGRRTTRDVLHPDRGTLVEAQFPEPQSPRPGLELADSDSLGEQGIIVLVSRVTGKDNLALQVGDGWVGDRLYRWEGSGDEAVTEWITRWASQEDVDDFVWGFGKMMAARFPETSLLDVEGAKELSTPGLSFRMERSPSEVRVLVVSGSPAD